MEGKVLFGTLPVKRGRESHFLSGILNRDILHIREVSGFSVVHASIHMVLGLQYRLSVIVVIDFGS